MTKYTKQSEPYSTHLIERKNMYKISKFTYSFENQKEELLLYNSYIGISSFCKLSSSKYKKIFLQNDLISLPQNIRDALLKHGIIVEQNIDEDQKLYTQFVDNLKSGELSLKINVTEECNFRCKYCNELHHQGEMTEEIQNNLVKFVRENIQKYSGLHIDWFGGEPLIAKNIIYSLSEKFIKICNHYKLPYSASIKTNGYLLKTEVMLKLLKYKVRHFQITLDGAKRVHNKYRVLYGGEPTYEKIMDNLIKIKQLNRKDFSVNLRSNLTEDSLSSFDEYLKDIEYLCKDDERFFVSVFKVGDRQENAHSDKKCKLTQQEDWLRKIYQKILTSNRHINLSTLFLNPGSGACHAGKINKYLIRSTGSVHQCNSTFDKPDSIVGTLSEGKLILNNNHDSIIIDPSICKEYLNYPNAPICMGQSCPIKKENNHCFTYCKYLDIILQIFDKMNWFDLIDLKKLSIG